MKIIEETPPHHHHHPAFSRCNSTLRLGLGVPPIGNFVQQNFVPAQGESTENPVPGKSRRGFRNYCVNSVEVQGENAESPS